MFNQQIYENDIQKLITSLKRASNGQAIGLNKNTSNLFRRSQKKKVALLDVSQFNSVYDIDPKAKIAQVGGMCTYEKVLDATLAFGLAPTVVPELKSITLGGAITGLGIESTSFRNGLPHEAVIEMDILLASGNVITATPDNEYSDLFHAIPNSYGTLGYITKATIALDPVLPYVDLRYIRFNDIEALLARLEAIISGNDKEFAEVDYLDGVVFSASESYLVVGKQTSEIGPVSDYKSDKIYYRAIQHDLKTTPKVDRLKIRDYYWRWDTDWFWCSRAFGTQNRYIRRIWPNRLKRSDFYWKIVALNRKYNFGDKISKLKGGKAQERVVQDIEIPLKNAAQFIDWFLKNIDIEPIWLCPLVLAKPNQFAKHVPDDSRKTLPWPLYPLKRSRIYLNVGFWSSVDMNPGDPAYTNKLIENQVTSLDGHKSLYSEAFYTENQFNQLYGGEYYRVLKNKYDPHGRFKTVYNKVITNR